MHRMLRCIPHSQGRRGCQGRRTRRRAEAVGTVACEQEIASWRAGVALRDERLLLVHPDVARLERLCAALLSVPDAWRHLALGRELSAVLRNEAPATRPSLVQSWLAQRLAELAPGPVLCTGIDLLFEPALRLDPLRLLRQTGRATPLAIAWPGTFANGALSYAVPAHAHYRTWRDPVARVVVLS